MFTEIHNDTPQIHSPPTDKMLWCYQVAKLQEVQANTRWFKYDRDWFLCKQVANVPVISEPSCTLKTSADRCCHITTGCPNVDYYETGWTSSMDGWGL